MPPTLIPAGLTLQSQNSVHALSEKEFEIINIIAQNIVTTQRQLASQTQMSLGMINILLKRLVTKGYLRTQQLDRRKVRFILTPKGLAEKARKSYRYTLKTIASLKSIRAALETILRDEYDRGTRHVFILGYGDLASLVEMVLRERISPAIRYSRVEQFPEKTSAESLLLLTDGSLSAPPEIRSLDVIKSLANVLVPAAEMRAL